MRLTGTSVRSGRVCCVSCQCAELYSGARGLLSSCGLRAGSVPRTLPLSALMFATLCLLSSLLSFCGLVLWVLLSPLNTTHRHTGTHSHAVLRNHRPGLSGFQALPTAPCLVPRSLSLSLSVSHWPFPLRVQVLELLEEKTCHNDVIAAVH